MSKTTRAAGKNKTQQTSLQFGDDASKMATGPAPLTLEALVIELEKSRKSMAAELNASMNEALAPMN